MAGVERRDADALVLVLVVVCGAGGNGRDGRSDFGAAVAEGIASGPVAGVVAACCRRGRC